MESKLYEISYLISPEAPEEGERAVESLKRSIEDRKGMVVEAGARRKVRLFHLIANNREAWFGYIKFLLKKEGLPRLQESWGKEKELLRHILARSEKAEPKRPPPTLPRPQPKQASVDIASLDKKLEEILGS